MTETLSISKCEKKQVEQGACPRGTLSQRAVCGQLVNGRYSRPRGHLSGRAIVLYSSPTSCGGMKFRTQSVQHIVELLGSRRASAGRTRSLDLSLNRGSEST